MFDAYGDITLSVSVEANTKKEMEAKLQELHNHNVQIQSLTLETNSGKLITVKVHDWEIDWERIYEEEITA